MDNYYAMMVDLSDKSCLVVGGGNVATRKVTTLVNAGAFVTVISPQATVRLRELALQGLISWQRKNYSSTLFSSEFVLAIAATSSLEINHRVYLDAKRFNCWVNVVDQPDLCNFTVPSTIKRGKLQLAISTSGACPTLAKQIRQDLEATYGTDYEIYLDLLHQMRQLIKKQIVDPDIRVAVIKKLVSKDWLALCSHNPEGIRQKMLKIINHYINSQEGRDVKA